MGFLCHLTRTYPSGFPYLKGIYNTLNAWRVGRNIDGWKISRTAWIELLSGDGIMDDEKMVECSFEQRKRKFTERYSGEVPEEVSPVPRLEKDLYALKELFQGDKPSLRLVRGRHHSSVAYGFGDASGDGFGSSWKLRGSQTESKVKYRFGLWGDEADGSSSNFRELANLVETFEAMALENALNGHEVYMFTDNSTAEAAFANGSSTSEKLFDLVLRLRQLEMSQEAKSFVCHVAGERMKQQGTDGLSRGNLTVGVMQGHDMLKYVPLHQTALERSPALKDWLLEWVGEDAEILDENQWFTRGHDHVLGKWNTTNDFQDNRVMQYPVIKPGTFIWSPAPCAAGAAVEELRKCRHKRQKSFHIVVIPRLMTTVWRKHLYKASDIVLTLPLGHPAWPNSMFEPLTLAILFPFCIF